MVNLIALLVSAFVIMIFHPDLALALVATFVPVAIEFASTFSVMKLYSDGWERRRVIEEEWWV